MTKEEIKTVVELFISWNGEEDPIDTSNLNSAVDYINECLSTSLPSDLDEAAEEALDDFDANWYIDERDDGCTEPGYNQKQMLLMFNAGAEWMQKQEEEYSPWLSINALEEASISFGEQAKMYEIGGQSFSEDMAVAFTRGAEWMAGQGETHELIVESPVLGPPMICCPVHADNGDKVVVQIRKK